MIKLAVTITFLETIEISDAEIAEYREEFPNATLDEIKEAYVQFIIDDNHYWDCNDVEYSEI